MPPSEISVNLGEKRWVLAEPDPAAVEALSHELQLPPALAAVLVQRGFDTVATARQFLDPRLRDLSDPFALPDMQPAVDRVLHAIDADERVVVYGDYDVDGITSSVLLRRVLDAAGAQVDNFLPSRMDEGYGLSHDGIARCVEQHRPALLIAVDCGTSSAAEIEALGEQGIDVIVLDHHEPPAALPPCVALVNPKCAVGGETAPFATAGLAFKFAHGLLKTGKDRGLAWADRIDLRDHLDLAATGTIADLVPLTGENRILAWAGLKRVGSTTKAGLRALQVVAGVRGEVRPYDIGFRLGPRLNAAGRLDDAMTALQLLLTEDMTRARELAEKLNEHNTERQRIQERMVTEALADAAAQVERGPDRVVVLARPGWHPGIVGIVASRVVQEHYRPAIVIALTEGDDAGKGSCRSIKGFSMVAALDACDDLLIQHGGHEMAAGLSVEPGQVDALRKRVNEYAASTLTEEILTPVLELGAVVSLGDLDRAFMAGLERFQPCGIGNPRPVLMVAGVTVAGRPRVVGQGHLKFAVTDGKRTVNAIWWGHGDVTLPAGSFDLAACPELNRYQGRETVQLNVRDVRPSP